MAFKIRRFTSDTVLATKTNREEAESVVDDYVTEHGGVLMIEEDEMTATCTTCSGPFAQCGGQHPKAKAPTAAQVKEAVLVDSASVSKGVYTVRKGFFYTRGYTAAKFVERVKEAYPAATIIDSGEVWKAFRGGQTTAQGSHWFVKFTLPKEA